MADQRSTHSVPAGRVHSAVMVVACALALASCGEDLGECDMNALGGSAMGTLAPHSGQIVVNSTCASGRCHSEAAKGKQRVGAPAELNFDVVPNDTTAESIARVTRGGGTVHDEAEEMWELIDSGEMPPEGQGAKMTGEQKEAVRNWLACGAEVIAAPAGGGPAPTDLTGIHKSLSELTCKACHSAGSDNNFLASDACAMHAALVGKTAQSTNPMGCGMSGMTLVVPGNPDGSLLIEKLKNRTGGMMPPCGSSMPVGGSPLEADHAPLFNAIKMWIAAGAPKPAGCP